jgi:putative transposase
MESFLIKENHTREDRGMKGKRFSPEQIIRIIKESEYGVKNIDICRKYGISEQTFYNWKNKYGGMEISDAMKLKVLEDENRKLKGLVADLSLDNKILKDLLEKNF